MPRVSYEAADRVAEKLAQKFADADWLTGVAVEIDDAEGYWVSVRVAPGAKAPRVERRMDGVLVRVVRRSGARAL